MGKVFRPSSRESTILSKIESSKEYARRQALRAIMDCIDPLSNSIAMKLLEEEIVETHNKNALEEQIYKCLEKLSHADEFDVDYQIAPFRNIVNNPHIVSLYLASFVIEKLIDHKDIIDVFGSDEDVYHVIHNQVVKYLPH